VEDFDWHSELCVRPVCCVLALLIWNIPDDDLIKQVLHMFDHRNPTSNTVLNPPTAALAGEGSA
jgi:hypothetical protein